MISSMCNKILLVGALSILFLSPCSLAFSPVDPTRYGGARSHSDMRQSPRYSTSNLFSISPLVDGFTIATDNAIQPWIQALPTPIGDNLETLLGAAVISTILFSITARPPSRLFSDATLERILEDTFVGRALSTRGGELRCVYKASRDGWSAIQFHEKVDNLGSGLVVVKTALGGKIFGGFNPSGWRSTDDYTTSTTAFLWCLQGGGQKVIQYPVQRGGPALFDYATAGPCFGTTDLVIGPPQAAILGGFAGPDMEDDGKTAGSLKRANVLPGQTYATDNQWPVRGYNVPLQEVEVYCLVEG